MSASSRSRWDYEVRLLALLAVCVSVFSFLYYFQRGDVLLYGDAVAHINIARRVFDSKTPGLLQLGTVWLPLPHLLMMPFLMSDRMWRSGTGGSIPSMVAYVLGVVGMFRLVRGVLSGGGESDTAARVAAWTAAVVYGANPNLIYMQTTAMGEAVYLCFFVWAVVYFSEFTQGEVMALKKCGCCLAAACLTRYDGWLLTAAMVVGVVVVSSLPAMGRGGGAPPDSRGRLSPHELSSHALGGRKAPVRFVLIAAAGPVLWLGYNAAVYRNALEFANGPYSARAIERKTGTVNPARGNLYAAGWYFLKAAELNVVESALVGRLWLGLAVLAIAAVMRKSQPRKEREDGVPRFIAPRFFSWSLLLLWIPLPFYAISVAYGGVPIFVPSWWPFSQYNLRYGLELLPALSASLGVLMYVGLKSASGIFRGAIALVVIAAVVAGYASAWQAGSICWREALVNSRGRIALEMQLANWFAKLPADSTLLMYLGEHPGAVEQAGIPLKRVINEGNHRVWKQPSDPEGLWERALAAPERFADYAVAFEGDRVWAATRGRGLKELVEIKVTGEPRAILFQVR